ncbi:MAG TPA: nucleoside deaminase [Candidatus Nanoarchaeia archaeon]|nr:nucleoside deaminase [Candidatus Woesearchaeota archaeon]HLC37529.1 nucleoside deaminase [Candidatus Nanoarchaeia archaeon]
MIQPAEKFMKAAIEEAIKSKEKGDYAVGAVIVKDSKIIIRVGNRVKLDQDPTNHAEIIAIREASRLLGSRHIKDCILYTTHEPCPMCSSAAIWAKMEGIVYGAKIEDMENYRIQNGNKELSWRTINIPTSQILEKGDPKLLLIEGFMREECKKLFHSLYH